jgi:hypothetical protein
MAMPLYAYTRRRLDARYHVQVKLTHHTSAQATDIVPVQGYVATIFRGDDKLKCGNEVRFSAAVYRNVEEIFPSGWLWTQLDSFNKAEYLEVFLNGVPPDCELADYKILIIDAPTESPIAQLPSEDEYLEQFAEFNSRGRPRATMIERLKSVLRYS